MNIVVDVGTETANTVNVDNTYNNLFKKKFTRE
jgi:hypothetical protein